MISPRVDLCRGAVPLLVVVAAILVSGSPCAAEETFPPLGAASPPATLDALWAPFDPRREPLEAEVLDAWEEDDAAFQLVRFTVGTFKGGPAKVAAFCGVPKAARGLPAILHIHGGGQSAQLDVVRTDVAHGYASLSLNWGGNKLNFGRSKRTYEGPQTDWGKLDATHPPQRNKANHFAGPLTPDEFTLDAVESPRNSNWFVVLVAARRALTWLEERPEVDRERLGVFGISMGGKLTTDLVGIDDRVKAAVPIYGGAGDILREQTELPGCVRRSLSACELACVSDNAYIPRIKAPVLWLSPTNDFNAPIENMAWNWRNLPDDQVRFSMPPHGNHRLTPEYEATRILWFEQHLKGAFVLPQTPRIELDLRTADGVPRVKVMPDPLLPVRCVEVHYSIDPHTLSRFWRTPETEAGDEAGAHATWSAACPVMSLDEPLFVFASVTYETPASVKVKVPAEFTISSRLLSVAPAALREAGVTPTDTPERLVDSGEKGWQDWYQQNWDHPPLWRAFTRKLKDPKWRGPDGARLSFEIRSDTANELVVVFETNGWGGVVPGKPAVDYAVVKPVPGGAEWQKIVVGLDELVATKPEITVPLADWRAVTQLSIGPSGELVRDGKKEAVAGRAWKGSKEIRNLSWE
jgi:hypothetical protein